MYSKNCQSKQVAFESTGRLLLIPIAFLLALTFVLLRPSLALADGGISVTTTKDEYSNPGPGDGCSLREAIQSANDDADFGGCTRSGTAPYTITVPAGIYTLTISSTGEKNNANGDLDLKASMTINGAGAGQTIVQAGPDAASGIDRVFNVPYDANSLTIYLSYLTIRHGRASDSGGGILHDGNGTLTVTDCAITDNESGPSYQGGGIHVANGTVTVNDSTVSNNTSPSSGGGLAVNGPGSAALYVNNSTISGNTAESNGGGGIRLQTGTLKIASSSIVSNTALYQGVDRGGGGIRTTVSPYPDIKNTIIANNSSNGEPGPDCQGTISSGGYNLIEDITDCGGTVGTDVTGQNPILGSLANNGGDTETHALLDGSPAIDAANPAGCTDVDGAVLTTDQRGMSRNFDGNGDNTATCDIGAFETQPDITVLEGSVIIPNGTGRVDFGRTKEGSPITKTFTISNSGTYTLTLTEPITVPTGFGVVNSFGRTVVPAGETTNFAARLEAVGSGIVYSGTLNFANDTADENPFTFFISGTVFTDTFTTITADTPDPSAVGQSYAVTTTVTSASSTPTGKVSVDDGMGDSCEITLTGGTGSCSLSAASIGNRTLTAEYAGEGIFGPSSDTEGHQVQTFDLAVTKNVVDTSVEGTTTFTYTVGVQNIGQIDAGGVVISDTLPASVTYVTSSTTNGSSYTAATGAWPVGNVAAGSGVTMTLVVTATNLGDEIIINTAELTASVPTDTNTTNNSASASAGGRNYYYQPIILKYSLP